MRFTHERQLSWAEWKAAVDWLRAHPAITVYHTRSGEPCHEFNLTLSTISSNNGRDPENRSYFIGGPDDLVVEYIMRWG